MYKHLIIKFIETQFFISEIEPIVIKGATIDNNTSERKVLLYKKVKK